jgi:hypothetical protein
MLRKTLLTLFAICLLSNCSHGPKATVCNGDVADNNLACSDAKGHQTTITYPQSDKFAAYPVGTYQSFLDWCANATPIIGAVQCTSDAMTQGLDCYSLSCSGTVCNKMNYSFLPWSQTDGYIFLSPSDDKAIKSYCGLSVQ